MTSKELERYLLSKIKMVIGSKFDKKPIQYLLFREMNKANGDLSIPRIMTRTVSSNNLRGYEEEEIKDGFIVAKQTNVIKHTIYINFVGIEQEYVAIVRNFFSHIRGFPWEVKKDGKTLVREEITPIRDITDHRSVGMLEGYQFQLIIRTTEKTETKIPIIKKIEFEVIGKKGE